MKKPPRRRETARPIPPPPLPHYSQGSTSGPQWKRILSRLGPGVLVFIAVSALVVWVDTLGRPTGPVVLLNYLALIGSCFAATAAIIWPWFRLWLYVPIASTATLILVTVFGWHDQYTVHWTSVWDPEKLEYVQTEEPLGWAEECDQPLIRYRDTYFRWRKTTSYREMRYREDDSSGLDDTHKGPRSESGKPHGQWHSVSWDPFHSEDEWYWYGEEISEGEWHLRNK